MTRGDLAVKVLMSRGHSRKQARLILKKADQDMQIGFGCIPFSRQIISDDQIEVEFAKAKAMFAVFDLNPKAAIRLYKSMFNERAKQN